MEVTYSTDYQREKVVSWVLYHFFFLLDGIVHLLNVVWSCKSHVSLGSSVLGVEIVSCLIIKDRSNMTTRWPSTVLSC